MADINKVIAYVHDIEELQRILKHLTDDSNKAVGGLIFPNSDTPGVNYTKFSTSVNSWLISAITTRIGIIKNYINGLKENFD